MAKKKSSEFDFVAAGKKQKAFRTPMMGGKAKNPVKDRQAEYDSSNRLVRDKKQPGVDVGQTLYDWLGIGTNNGKFGIDLAMALPIGKVSKAAKALSAAGRIGTAAQLASRVATKKAGWEAAKRTAAIRKYGNQFSFPQTPAGPRIGSTAYPKSFGQTGQRAPVSEMFGPKSPTAGTFKIGGKRFVDNRYRFNMPKPRTGKQDRGVK